MLLLRLYSALFFVLSAACTTLVDDPGGFREQKSLTVGFPGAIKNPTRGTAIGFTLNKPESKTMLVNSGEKGEAATSINLDAAEDDRTRKVQKESWGFDVFATVFPSSKSFFFFGVGALAERTRSAYAEHTAEFGLTRSTTNVEWIDQSVAVTVPLGITVNTKEGITTMAAVGPKWRVSNQRTFLDDGGDGRVDQETRDETLASYDEDSKGVGFHFLALVGYSF